MYYVQCLMRINFSDIDCSVGDGHLKSRRELFFDSVRTMYVFRASFSKRAFETIFTYAQIPLENADTVETDLKQALMVN